MDDGSDVDAAAATSQVRNPLAAVTHAQRQAQASNKLTSAHRSAHMSRRVVPDDEEDTDEEAKTDKEDEDEDEDKDDNIYGGIDGDAGDALRKEVQPLSHWHVFQVYIS